MRDQWIFAFVIALFLLLTILYPSLGWLTNRTIFRDPTNNGRVEELTRRNQELEAALSVSRTAGTTDALPDLKSAFVFSRYPLNFKHELLISSGSAGGVEVGDIAILPAVTSSSGGVLVGKVTRVFKNTALVQTVFDPAFESAVRIGDAGVDALLKGGSTPRLSLLPRRAGVKAGTIVYAASASLPYGLAIGTVSTVAPSSDNVFDEVVLEFAYDVNRLTAVRIVPAPR